MSETRLTEDGEFVRLDTAEKYRARAEEAEARLAKVEALHIGVTTAGDTALMVKVPVEPGGEPYLPMTLVEKCDLLPEVWDAVVAALSTDEARREPTA